MITATPGLQLFHWFFFKSRFVNKTIVLTTGRNDASYTCPFYFLYLLQAERWPCNSRFNVSEDTSLELLKERQFSGTQPLICRQVIILGKIPVLGPQSGISLRSKQLDSEAGPLSHEGQSRCRKQMSLVVIIKHLETVGVVSVFCVSSAVLAFCAENRTHVPFPSVVRQHSSKEALRQITLCCKLPG